MSDPAQHSPVTYIMIVMLLHRNIIIANAQYKMRYQIFNEYPVMEQGKYGGDSPSNMAVMLNMTVSVDGPTRHAPNSLPALSFNIMQLHHKQQQIPSGTLVAK